MECNLSAEQIAVTFVRDGKSSAELVNFVPYAPGGINYFETNGDVMSGIFTGCVMTAYTHKNVRRVCHVHTGGDAGEGLDCKSLMKTMLDSADYNNLLSFKPYSDGDDFPTAEKIIREANVGASGCATFGLLTNANKAYSIMTRKVSNHEYVVEKVIEKTSKPYTFV
ncbi:MAG: hypothetical protein ACSHYA_16560 [Opitutaceae bacterium]